MFCENEYDHEHTSVNDCQSNCGQQIHDSQSDKSPFQYTDYQEIKNYFTTSLLFRKYVPRDNINRKSILHLNFSQYFIKEIFHPPIG